MTAPAPSAPTSRPLPTDPALPLPGGIAFIGAGRLAQALARALGAIGQPTLAVASRRLVSAQALADAVGAMATDAKGAVQRANLVFLTVPDDALQATADGLPWRAGQAVVHCSGATDLAALDAAARAGAEVGGFHPLQIFSDPAQAAHLLAGSSVAIEAGPALRPTLQALAAGLGMRVLTLRPGTRALYHAGAGYAASGLLPALQEAVALWRHLGIDEAAALQALLPLARGTLAAVAARGVAGAVSGPVSRGDVGVLARQQSALAALGPAHTAFFKLNVNALLSLAEAAGRLDAAQVAQLQAVLDTPHQPF